MMFFVSPASLILWEGFIALPSFVGCPMSSGFSFGREGLTPSQLRSANLTTDSRQFVFKTENAPGLFRSRVYQIASLTRISGLAQYWLDGLFAGLGQHHGTLSCINPLTGRVLFERDY